jgi:hypothetical protein
MDSDSQVLRDWFHDIPAEILNLTRQYPASMTVIPRGLVAKQELKFDYIEPDGKQTKTFNFAKSEPTPNLPLGTAILNGKEVFIVANPFDVTAICSQTELYILPTEVNIELSGRSILRWNLGQFDDKVLAVLKYLLSLLPVALRHDLVQVSRHLSATTNSDDDDGILEGKWTNDYKDGDMKPWQWTGTPEIMARYDKNHIPVEYGQCWVFAGILASLFRALGVCSRIVTNVASAHNTTPNDDIIDEEGDDSIWNFHVFVEIWLTRADQSGWQVVDATPQETSDSLSQCGPAPVSAIKALKVYFSQRDYETLCSRNIVKLRKKLRKAKNRVDRALCKTLKCKIRQNHLPFDSWCGQQLDLSFHCATEKYESTPPCNYDVDFVHDEVKYINNCTLVPYLQHGILTTDGIEIGRDIMDITHIYI